MDDDKRHGRRYYGRWRGGGGAGFAYFLGIIGSAVYYIQNASTFGAGFIGLLKALVWPAFLVYHLLRLG